MAAVLLLAVASLLLPPAAAQPSWPVCGNSGSYMENSTYQSNLDQLSATLPTNASRALFATAAVGAAPDIVYTLALCRGDTNASTCESCVTAAFPEAQMLCDSDEDVAVFYDDCSLRFSNQNFLADSSKANLTMITSQQNVSSPAEVFDAAVGILLNATGNYAATNSSRRFATGEEGFDSRYPTIYGLAQCTPDMSPAACRSCLDDIISLMPKYLSRRQGGRIIGVRCYFRYELSKFFTGDPTLRLQTPLAPAPAPDDTMPTPASPGGRTRKKMKIVLSISLPVVAVMLAIAIFCLCFLRRRRLARERAPSYSTKPEDIECIGSLLLDLSTIRAATGNFAESNWVGEGGFGAVYKGVLPDGQEIAVKRFSQSSGQGIQELKNELVLIAKLQHKNLVRLLGVCLQEHEKLLVYEYMPNRSIDTIIFEPEKSKELDWGRRFNIINGIARDFGLARLFGGDQSREATNSVVGTYGYMSPEYAMRGHYSIKSDVFSFGVLILEILTGRRSSGSYTFDESVDLISLVWENWTTGTIMEIMDSSMRGNAPGDQMLKCSHIGLLCVQDNPVDRPVMSKVNVMLSSDTVSLQAPLKPEFFIPKSGTYSTEIYSESYPMASQSTTTSEK
ncbi:unnamed protein product [Urochloa humidicola]